MSNISDTVTINNKSLVEKLSATDGNTTSDISVNSDTPPREFTLKFALDFIAKKYKKDFPNIKFVAPLQIVDGSTIEFIDGDANDTFLASARLRLINQLGVDNMGNLSIGACLSELNFTRQSISFNVKLKK